MTAEPDETTRRILRAARACFAATGARRTTMNQIAAEAGLGVATVYRRFPQKGALVRAAVTTEAQSLIAEVAAAVEGLDTLEDQAVEGFLAFTRGLAARHLLRGVAAGDPDVAHFLTGQQGLGTVIGLAREHLSHVLAHAQSQGDLPPFDPAIVADLYARIAASLVLAPDGPIPLKDEAATRGFARTYLLPLLNADPRLE